MLKRLALSMAALSVVSVAVAAQTTIVADKLSQPQIMAAVKNASDDTVIEFQGVKKTKAQWRAEEMARSKPTDTAKVKELERERNAQLEARNIQLDKEQDSRIEAENTAATAKFKELARRQRETKSQIKDTRP
ncbi:hypothetical protein GCM10007862_04210 [Dyella lipolytica]|uniref:DUF4398 domain-containing protein n=1 Tax=Dyella lipolytica TaxID=1867835 RepID=A0ABW8J2K1_9GAMM|nr:hypothetical protein [Dyella lipolytica]GLQ45370.1 hypothetical protein GCM10007862_04210 [Dyella lipolytica]